ncbi:unnamed protein product, partial [Nesidiocoris tenuis]
MLKTLSIQVPLLSHPNDRQSEGRFDIVHASTRVALSEGGRRPRFGGIAPLNTPCHSRSTFTGRKWTARGCQRREGNGGHGVRAHEISGLC